VKTVCNILRGLGAFSLVMTGIHLWQVGLPQLEGPEGETWEQAISILASYAIMGLLSAGLIVLGSFLKNRSAKREGSKVQASEAGAAASSKTTPMRLGYVSLSGNKVAANIGIEIQGGDFVPFVMAGTKVPCDHHEIFSTAADDQESIEIRVLQGSGDSASQNKEIGAFTVTDIPSQPRGKPQVDVCLSVLADGAFSVHARDLNGVKDLHVRSEVTCVSGSPEQDEMEMRVRQILRGRSDDVIARVLLTLREIASARPLPDMGSSDFEGIVKVTHDYQVGHPAKREGSEDERAFSDWDHILVTQSPDQSSDTLTEKDKAQTDPASRGGPSKVEGKRCAMCWEELKGSSLTCPKCGSGVFVSSKTPPELRAGRRARADQSIAAHAHGSSRRTEYHMSAYPDLLGKLKALLIAANRWGAQNAYPLYEKYPQYGDIREIGERLNSMGGIELMRKAHNEVERSIPYPGMSDYWWDYVGSWRA
jgi:hypothetical protein